MLLHRSNAKVRVARAFTPLFHRHLAFTFSTSSSAPSSDPPSDLEKPVYNYTHTPSSPNPDQALRSSTLSSHTPPPPPPEDKTKKSLLSRGPGLAAFFKNAWKDYRESANQKILNPSEGWKDVAGDERPTVSTLTHQWNRFRQQIGFKLDPVEPFRTVLTFSPNTDLKKFTLLNDNAFGGSSTCTMDLKEYIAVDANGTEIKTYTIVFRGELRPLRSFQTSASRWVDDEGRPAVIKNPISAATGGPQLVSTKPAPPANAPPASTLSSTPPSTKATAAASSTPPAASTLQSTPPGMKPKLASSLSAANTTPIDRTAPGFNPFTSPSTASTPSSSSSSSSAASSSPNPFLTRTQTPVIPPPSVTADAEAPVSSFFRSPPPPSKKDPTLINGFAAFISPLYKYPDLDLERYDFLSMQVRTDGRPYIFNVRCREGPTSSHGFVYQARIREEAPRPMHKLEIRFENFICTQSGRMRSFGTSLPKDRIESFGFSVTGPEGPFEIEIESINAQTGTPDFELKARREALIVEERTKNAMVQQRLSEVAKRQAVAAELARLRKEKNQPEAPLEGGFLRELAWRFSNSDRAVSPVESEDVNEEDLKGFPEEIQKQMRADRTLRLKQQEELKEKMRKELEKKKTEETANQSTTEASTSQPTAQSELEKEIRERVEHEFSEAKEKEELPVGDRGTRF